MRIAVIRPPAREDVVRRRVQVREWEGYEENARDICAALGDLGHEAIVLRDGSGLAASLRALTPDAAWVCSAGGQGRDPMAHLPAVLELMGLSYVGSLPLAAALADHKPTAKRLFRALGVPTPADGDACGFPCVIKPANGLAGCGVFLAHDEAQLHSHAAAVRARYGPDMLVERYIEGVDITLAMIEVDGRIEFLAPLLRSVSWRSDDIPGDELEHPRSGLAEGPPAELPADAGIDLAALRRHALAAFRGVRLRQLARMDFRVGPAGAFLLEANHKPDLRRAGLVATAARLAGLAYPELVRTLLDGALRADPALVPAAEGV